jgi:glutathione S-transferase
MKLYYTPGTCALSPHIVLSEAGLPHTLAKVNLRTKTVDEDRNYLSVNPKGYVPTLELDDGSVLTEGPAIVQYLADLAPASKLAPANGTIERYRLQEWLNFITAELHKQFSLLFNAATPDDVKAAQREKIGGRLNWLAPQLESKDYLLGETFTVADAYLFTVLRWCDGMGIELAKWPALKRYVDRVGTRPKVVEALKAEGLVKN